MRHRVLASTFHRRTVLLVTIRHLSNDRGRDVDVNNVLISMLVHVLAQCYDGAVRFSNTRVAATDVEDAAGLRHGLGDLAADPQERLIPVELFRLSTRSMLNSWGTVGSAPPSSRPSRNSPFLILFIREICIILWHARISEQGRVREDVDEK